MAVHVRLIRRKPFPTGGKAPGSRPPLGGTSGHNVDFDLLTLLKTYPQIHLHEVAANSTELRAEGWTRPVNSPDQGT